MLRSQLIWIGLRTNPEAAASAPISSSHIALMRTLFLIGFFWSTAIEPGLPNYIIIVSAAIVSAAPRP
jgi:hypothetical protein